jgi:tRNA (guanine37-N1)-methyltransferase
MLGLKVPLKHAEKWKNLLLEEELFDKTHYYLKDEKDIYFPILKKFDAKSKKVSFVDKDFPKSVLKGTLKENLSNSLTKEELAFVKTAHDTIGNIAILEIPKDLEKREKIIAETLLKVNPQIKTVLKKADIHGGVYRTQKMQYLAGVETKETLYKENNVILKLDVERVYFSVRLSNERKRIMQLVKPGEDILVMFSGCAPYPIVLAKNTQARHITGIEINPDGHKYGMENLSLNKIKNVILLCGDVHDIIPMLRETTKDLSYDRIIMPLPKTADEFLGDALLVARKGTIIHFYDFLEIGKFDDAVKKIDAVCKKRKIEYKVHDIVKCGQHAPYVFRICVDFEIL